MKNFRILFLLTSLLVGATSVYAQQDKLLTHFIFDKMSLNPGATGVEIDGVCGTSVYRNQWDKVVGAPNSTIFNVEANMKRFYPGGLGVSFFYDAIGFNRQNSLLLNYAYQLVNENGNKLSAGLGLGILNFGMTPTWVPPTTSLDNSLPTGFSGTGLDLNLGVYYKSNLGFYAGISATHLNALQLKNKLSSTAQAYQVDRHYYLMGGYKRAIGANAVDVQMLVRSVLYKTSIDLNARFLYRNFGYVGLTYRTSDAISIMLGYNVSRSLSVGYSYDVTLNKLSGISRGSHEILLKYCRPIPVPPVTISRHPRWL